MEKSLQKKRREDSRHRSPTPASSLRGVPHGAEETTMEGQPEALEAPRSRQEKVSGSTAVSRGEGEENKVRAARGTSLQRQGPPGRESGKEQGPPYESDPQEKIKGTAHLDPPQDQERTDRDEKGETSDGEERTPKRKTDTGIQGAGEAKRRSRQNQEPT